MPRTCTICGHPERETIDAALVAGEPYRDIAAQYGTTPSALSRHKRDHLPASVAQAQEAHEVARGDDLLAQLAALRTDAARIGAKAEKAQSYAAALQAVREQARIIELLLEVAGELERGVSVTLAPEWLVLRATILQALGPYPEARHAVAEVVSGRTSA